MQSTSLKLLLVVSLGFLQSGDTLRGDVTYYSGWNHGWGSCGLDISMENQFYVLALGMKYMTLPENETNTHNHPLCGPNACAKIYGERGTVVLKISDTCGGCLDDNIDVADTVFPMLDDPIKGVVPMDWEFVDCSVDPPGKKTAKSEFFLDLHLSRKIIYN